MPEVSELPRRLLRSAASARAPLRSVEAAPSFREMPFVVPPRLSMVSFAEATVLRASSMERPASSMPPERSSSDSPHGLDVRLEAGAGARRAVEGLARGGAELVGDDARDRSGKRVVDLALDGGGAGVRHLGRDGVFLLVHVVLDVGLRGLAVDDAREGRREVLGDDDGGVVFARTDSLQGLRPLHEAPAELLVVVELLHDHVAGRDVAHVADGCALVLVDDGDLDVARVLVRVPVREDVEPGVQGRDDADSERDDEGDGVFEDAPYVAPEDPEGCLHVQTPWLA